MRETVFKDKHTTIKEAMDYIATRCRFSYEFNERAFEAAGMSADSSLTTTFLEKRPFKPGDECRLFALLQDVVSRMPVKGSEAPSFVVRRDHIEITTVGALGREIYGPNCKGPVRQIVEVNFKKRRLDEALAELADKADMNIVVDWRVGSVREKEISFQAANMDVDEVVRLMATQMGLRAYRVDNVFLVTMKQHAEELQRREPGRERSPVGLP